MPQFFIDRPIFAWVVALAITLAGLVSLSGMPVSQYPNVAPPAVEIAANYPGASAEEVSRSVANVIENVLNGAKGLLYYESVSDSYGRAQITATFAPGTNPDLAQVDVQNRISNITAQLPSAVIQQGLQVRQTMTNFLMVVTLSGKDDSVTAMQLTDYITRNVQNPISRIPGIGNFQLFGSPRAMRVWVDPDKLVGYGLSFSDINNAIATQNIPVSAGILGAPPNPRDLRVAAPIVVNGELTSVEEFEQILLRANIDGSVVRMKDVARVEVGTDTYQFGARLNGRATTAFALSLTPEANALETATAVREKMEELARFFPDNVEYVVPYDTTPYVKISIEQVIYTLLEAMVLVFLVMFLFLQNVRYTLIPALVVPVAMLGAFAVMYALGFSINVLTMFAMVLAIGILVDDAIVVVENVERIMGEEGLSPKEATKKAMPQIGNAIVGITLVLSAVFLPLAFMGGSVGIIYRQFSIAMAVSIMFSGFLALSFTPALCATLLKPIDLEHHQDKRGFFGWFNRVFTRITRGYTGWVGGSLKRVGRMMVVYLMLAAGMGYLYLRMPTGFLPTEDQGFIIASIELPAGSTSNRTVDIIEQVEQYFLAQPKVKSIVAVQGFSFNGTGLNSAIAFASLEDFEQRKSPGDSAGAIAGQAIGRLLFGLPDAMVFSVVPPAINELGNASGFDLRLQDRSNLGHDALMQATQQLLGLAAQSPILTQVRITGLGAGPQLRVTVDRDKAAALGVSFPEVANLLSTALGSSYINKFPNLGRLQNVWVQADAEHRVRPDDILKLNARNQRGEVVPLSSFVNIQMETGPTQIVRYNSYESIRISGDAAPGYATGEAMAEMERLMTQLPVGFGHEWTGLSYQERQAGSQAVILLGLAMLVVFMVLAALYESWAIPLSVVLAVPLGMLGAVGLVTAMGLNNDIFFQVGMVTVIGLAAKNAILIVEFAKDLYAVNGNLFASTVEAAKLRFRPILMTSFAFILGVVPLVLASGAGAASQNAVGLGVFGGMLAATPLAVLFVPAFFVVVIKVFKTKPRLLGSGHAIHALPVQADATAQSSEKGQA